MHIHNHVKYACRIVVGAAFVASAILKLLSLEAFELYVYGFEWFGLAISSHIARLILAMEMFTGLSLVLGVKTKWANGVAFSMLSLFSLFLLYLIFIGSDGNCHCFGEQFELNPLPSLGKNILMIAMLAVAWPAKDWLPKFSKYILPALFLWSVVFGFVLKLPYGFGTEKVVKFAPAKYEAFVGEHPALNRPGKQVVAFFSTYCKHCKAAMKRLQVALHRNDFPSDQVSWFVMGTDVSYQKFMEETSLEERSHELLPGKILFGVTDGSVPLILLVEDGEVKGKLSNATFKEELINDFCASGK
ncbi:MAG: hypothetical protein MJZ14_08655 [Paludibacteraceae bacterium]|nr:hypothetical protein [Paludibacteraceae bacterium]